MYNMTFMETSTDALQIWSGVDTHLTNGLYSAIVLLGVFLVSFMVMKNYETLTALLASSFITSILAIMLFTINLIRLEILLIPIILTLITIFINIIKEG